MASEGTWRHPGVPRGEDRHGQSQVCGGKVDPGRLRTEEVICILRFQGISCCQASNIEHFMGPESI